MTSRQFRRSRCVPEIHRAIDELNSAPLITPQLLLALVRVSASILFRKRCQPCPAKPSAIPRPTNSSRPRIQLSSSSITSQSRFRRSARYRATSWCSISYAPLRQRCITSSRAVESFPVRFETSATFDFHRRSVRALVTGKAGGLFVRSMPRSPHRTAEPPWLPSCRQSARSRPPPLPKYPASSVIWPSF
jgi:hypothetical protein